MNPDTSKYNTKIFLMPTSILNQFIHGTKIYKSKPLHDKGCLQNGRFEHHVRSTCFLDGFIVRICLVFTGDTVMKLASHNLCVLTVRQSEITATCLRSFTRPSARSSANIRSVLPNLFV